MAIYTYYTAGAPGCYNKEKLFLFRDQGNHKLAAEGFPQQFASIFKVLFFNAFGAFGCIGAGSRAGSKGNEEGGGQQAQADKQQQR